MKKIIFSVLVLIAVAVVPLLSHAQFYNDGRRIMNLLPERDGVAYFRYSYNNQASFNAAPGQEVEYHVFDLAGSYPFAVSDDIFLGAGVSYDLHYFRLHNVTNYLTDSSIFVHTIGVPLDAVFVLSNDWILDVNATPMLASDLENINSGRDFQIYGHVLAGWAFADSASIFLGVAVGKMFWEYLPYPLLGFVYRPEYGFFNMEAMLPNYIRFNFDVLHYLTLFAQGEFKGYVWDVTNNGTVPNHFMKMYDSHAGAGANFKVLDGINMEVWGGINPYRKYNYRDRLGNSFNTRQNLNYFVEAKVSLTADLFMRD